MQLCKDKLNISSYTIKQEPIKNVAVSKCCFLSETKQALMGLFQTFQTLQGGPLPAIR